MELRFYVVFYGYAIVAQLVEQLICNQPVGGSSPLNGSIRSFKILCISFPNIAILVNRNFWGCARAVKGNGL